MLQSGSSSPRPISAASPPALAAPAEAGIAASVVRKVRLKAATLAHSVRASGIRIGGLVAPRAAGKAAFSLFCTPDVNLKHAAQARYAHKLASAEVRRIGSPHATLQTYIWRTPQETSRGRVLLLHGWTGQALAMLMFVKPLLDAGFDCVAFDFPAHGQSTGRRLNLPIGADSVLAVADALGRFTGVVAHSLGGLIAGLAMEGGAPMTRRLEVERLVLIASPNSLAELTRNFAADRRFPARTHSSINEEIERLCGRAIDELNAGDFLLASGTPTLIIHDEHDEEVRISAAHEILNRAESTVQLMTTAGLGHRRIVVSSRVVRAAVRHLAS